MDFAVASFPDLVNVDFIFAGPYSPFAVVHIGGGLVRTPSPSDSYRKQRSW